MTRSTVPSPYVRFLETDQLATAMHRAGHAWRSALNEALAPFKLTYLQWAVVSTAATSPGLNQSELAERIGIEGPSLVRVLDGLEAGGWLSRQPGADDRRTKRVFVGVSESSDQRLEQVLAAVRAVHTRAVRKFSPAQYAQLVTLMDL